VWTTWRASDDPPRLGKLTHIEQVVKLGRRGEHLRLDFVPQVDSNWHQLPSYIHHLGVEASGAKLHNITVLSLVYYSSTR